MTTKLKVQIFETLLAMPAVFILFIIINTHANGQSPSDRGLEIYEKISAQSEGFKDSTALMTMTIINRSGKKSIRKIRTKTLEVINDGDKSMAIFDEPADVRGTAMLTYSHVDVANEQWMYLPSIKRVKRISSKNKSGAFMGSEFSFEDLGQQEVPKYTYKYLSESQINGIPVHSIEAVPTYKYSGYTRLVSYIDKDRLINLKTEYYDLKNELLKTLVLSDYVHHNDKHWRPSRMEMFNEQTNKRTILEFSNYQFSTGLKDKDFTSSALKNIR